MPERSDAPDAVARSGIAELSGPLSGALGRNALALLAARGAVFALQFVALAALASYLGPGDLGIYLFAVAFAGLFRIVPNFGLSPILTREIAQRPGSESSLVPNALYLRLVLGLLALGVLAATIRIAGFEGSKAHAALVAGTLLVFAALDSFVAVLQVRLMQRWVAIADVLEAVTVVVGVFALRARGDGVTAFLVLYVASNVLNMVVVGLVALRLGRFDWSPRARLLGPVLTAAAPLALATLFITLYFRIDIVILARLKSAADVGQYGAAYRFLEAILVVSPVLMSVVSPVIAQSFAAGGDVLQRRYARLMHLLTLVALPVAVVGAMTAWRWFPLLPGFSQYHGAGRTLAILSPAAALALIGGAVQGMLVNAHLQARVLAISTIGVVLNLVANVALIPPFSYVGAAVATTVTELAVCGLTIFAAARQVDLRWPTDRLARALIPTAILAGALALGLGLHPVIQLALGIGVYLAALWPTRALRGADIAGLAGRFPRAG